MNQIQLGIDLATSISVVAAALSFVRAQATQSKATRLGNPPLKKPRSKVEFTPKV